MALWNRLVGLEDFQIIESSSLSLKKVGLPNEQMKKKGPVLLFRLSFRGMVCGDYETLGSPH